MQSVKIYKKIKIFWDIDGTLLQTHGAAAVPFANAVSKFAGQEVQIERKKLSGFTDYEIAQYLLKSINIEIPFNEITQILNEYSLLLPRSLRESKTQVIGEIKKTLIMLHESPNIELAIGTGNCRSGALIKLKHVDLLQYFNKNNLFCSTEKDWNRNSVIGNAKTSLAEDQVGIVIGDSPRDILSAKNSDLFVMAAATGAHSSVELLDMNPDYLLQNNWTSDDLFKGLDRIL
jgi:phosphoglycolate phosphatase